MVCEINHFVHILFKIRSVSNPFLPIAPSMGDYMDHVIVVVVCLVAFVGLSWR